MFIVGSGVAEGEGEEKGLMKLLLVKHQESLLGNLISPAR